MRRIALSALLISLSACGMLRMQRLKKSIARVVRASCPKQVLPRLQKRAYRYHETKGFKVSKVLLQTQLDYWKNKKTTSPFLYGVPGSVLLTMAPFLEPLYGLPCMALGVLSYHKAWQSKELKIKKYDQIKLLEKQEEEILKIEQEES